ncbi:MAG: hypothetical protein ABH828_01325 [archaeon]
MKRIVFLLMFLLVLGMVSAADHECFDINTDACGDIDVTNDVVVNGNMLAEFFNVTTIIYANTFSLTPLGSFPTMVINITNNNAVFKTDITVNGGLAVNNALSAGSMAVVGNFVANKFIGFLNLEAACDEASNRVVGSVTGVSFVFKSDTPSC